VLDPDREPNRSPITWEEIAALKKADRAELAALPPDEAQAAVEQILFPRLWRIEDPRQLAWPGDLADDDEDEEEHATPG
jgi:hypothetical protein